MANYDYKEIDIPTTRKVHMKEKKKRLKCTKQQQQQQRMVHTERKREENSSLVAQGYSKDLEQTTYPQIALAQAQRELLEWIDLHEFEEVVYEESDDNHIDYQHAFVAVDVTFSTR